MKLVCFGDSLTYGYGVNTEECWCDIVQKKHEIILINKGLNGDTTSGMLFRSYKDIVSLKPSHCIIMGGTNDLLLNISLNNVINNIKLLINECLNNHIIPLMAIQPPVYPKGAIEYWQDGIDYLMVNENIKLYRRTIIDFCIKNHITYFDFYEIFEDCSKVLSHLYLDGIHPTAEGHKLMSEIVKF